MSATTAASLDAEPPVPSQKATAPATPLLDALLALAGLLGKSLSREQLTYGLMIGSGDLPLETVVQVMARAGLAARIVSRYKIEDAQLPLAARLKDGNVAVIVRREDDHYVLADTEIPGGERRLVEKELLDALDGTQIRVAHALGDVSRRHLGPTSNGHWFWARFRNQRGLLANIAVSSLFANLLAVSVSIFALQVYDRVIPNQSMTSLWVLVAGAIIAVALEAMLRVSRSTLLDASGKRIEVEVSNFLMDKLCGMNLSKRPASPGSLVHTMREFGSVREFFTNSSIGSVADIPFVLIFLALIYLIAGNTVWIVGGGMILIVLPSLLMQARMSRLSNEMQGGTAAAGKLLTELSYGHEAVKASAGEAHFISRWYEITALNALKTTEQRALAAKLTHWATGIQQVTYVSTVVAGVYAVFAGVGTVGTIIAISILSSRTLAPVTQLSGMLSRWQLVKSSLDGLDAVAAAPQDRDIDRSYVRRRILDGDIELSNVGFHYTEDSPVSLNIPDLRIGDGTVVGVLGENGSGKSTLLKVLSGLYTVNTGAISIGGLDLAHLDPSDVRRNVGYLPQEVRLFSGTLRDNLLLGNGTTDDERIQQALHFSGLNRLVERQPLGLDMPIADGGDGMSVGQRHSLGLARLFLQDPRVVLLDEPTASLDQVLEANIVKAMGIWLQGRTCIVATHRIPILSLTHRVIVMQEGHITMDGSTDDVIKRLTARPVDAA